MPISNRLYPRTSLKLRIPTSPESDGEVYLTPNTSATLDDEQGDSGLDERIETRGGSVNGRNRMNKIQSMSSISKKLNEMIEGGDEVDGHVIRTPETNGIYRMNSLGNLSQYEREFGATPKSLIKLKEDFENRRKAMLAQRKSLANILEPNGTENVENVMPETIEFVVPTEPLNPVIFASRRNQANGRYKKRFNIGDTKYIGNEADTPEQKPYPLTKMKSLSTIPDLEHINFEPFLTPMIARKQPLSLHSFEEERQSSGSSDSGDQEDFLRRMPGGRQKVSFERGFRRSYTRSECQPSPDARMRQSDGCFHLPSFPAPRKAANQPSNEQKCRSSVHSLPSDGKYDAIRYERVDAKLIIS